MENNLKILLLEDSQPDAEMVQRFLQTIHPHWDFRVAVNRNTYLQLLEEFKPDVILSDNSMPQFSAAEALEIKKQQGFPGPFIMVTGTATEEFAASMIRMGADDYILKDRPARLPAAIDMALKQKKARKEKLVAERKNEESKNNLKAIFENTSEGFLLLNVDGKVKALNTRAARYGMLIDKKEIRTGDSFFDLVRDDKNAVFKEAAVKALQGESVQYEWAFQPGDDAVLWIGFSMNPVFESGTLTGICITGRDITERKKTDAALDATLKELSDYKVALDESSIVSITNPKGIISYVNSNFCKISKYNPHELLGKNHRIVNSSFHEKSFIKELWSTILGGNIWRNEVRNKAKDGTLFWVDATIVPFLDHKQKPLQFVAINKDITEKKRIEYELLQQKVQEQKRITRAMIVVQEQERNRLGTELHDNINQILAGTKLFLGMAGNNNPAFKELIRYPMELIDNSIEEIRLLCRRLVTPLKNIDLDQMVRHLLDNIRHTTSLQTEFAYSPGRLLFNDDLKLNIFRIIQEQMNNIVKYAHAKNVSISLTENNGILYVKITDDGVGFVVTSERTGIGITNMTNRIESYNGKIDINSSPDNGCTISIEVPI